jgi:fructose-1-phosphate kinase PfkB-like protein
VHITLETGCFALVREERQTKRLRALSPQLEPISTVGAGDVLLAQWLASTLERKPAADALRVSVAAGAASVLMAGAGRFDPKEAARLATLVELDEPTPAA